jgi:CHAT domain-containing protein
MNIRTIVLIYILGILSSLLPAQSQLRDTATAINYNNSAHNFRKNYQYDSAALYFEIAANIFEKNRMWVECVHNLNESIRMHYKEQQINKALNNIDKGMLITKNHFLNNNTLELTEIVNLIRYKGVLFKNLGDNEKALFFFNRSLEYNLMLKDFDTLNYLINESKLLFGIGIVYMIDRKKDSAISYFKRSLNIQKSLPFDPDFNLTIIYLNIGSVYKDYRDIESATQYYIKAKESNSHKYNNFDLIDSYVNNQMGLLLFDQEKYPEALEYLKKALIKKKKLFGNNHAIVADENSTIALVHLKNGSFDEAIDNANSALRINLKLYGDSSSQVADTYVKLSELCSSKKEYDETIKYLNQALDIQLHQVGDKHFTVSIINNMLGDAYANLTDWGKSLYYYQHALLSNITEFNETGIYRNPGLSDHIFSRSDLLYTLQKKADILYQLHLDRYNDTLNILSSYSTYELSFQLANMIRQDHRSEEAKMIISENIRPVFNNAINVAYEINSSICDEYKTKIFDFMEASKSSTLYSMITELDAAMYSGIPEILLEKDKNLKSDLTFFNTQIEKIKQQNGMHDTALLKRYEQRYFELFVQRDSLLNEISDKYPAYNKKKVITNLASIEEIQLNLDDHTALIEYFTSDADIYIFVITKELNHLMKVTNTDQLKKQTLQFHKNIRKRGDKKLIADLSHQLYNTLIKPIESLLEGKEKLIIIPDEYLLYLPFEALSRTPINDETEIKFSKLDYLVRDFDISYHYLATIWNNCKEMGVENKIITDSSSLCAFAPVFTEGNASISRSFTIISDTLHSWRSISVDGKTFNNLPFSKMEVDTITNLFIKNNIRAKSFLYQEASEENFRKAIVDYQIIHIATHGFSNDLDPNLSGLVFSQKQDYSTINKVTGKKNAFESHNNFDPGNDGILYSAEMYNLRIRANLVVLSACETGIGKPRKGEGLMAMTRGLVYSGVPNIVYTLWKVSDNHTHILMAAFYNELINGNTYSSSLRKAKLKMLDIEATAFPGLWSGFLFSGQ